jgi:hypothetical protein
MRQSRRPGFVAAALYRFLRMDGAVCISGAVGGNRAVAHSRMERTGLI